MKWSGGGENLTEREKYDGGRGKCCREGGGYISQVIYLQ